MGLPRPDFISVRNDKTATLVGQESCTPDIRG